MRRYEFQRDDAPPFVFDGERLASVCGAQAPLGSDDEVDFAMHLFRAATHGLVVAREGVRHAGRSCRIVIAADLASDLVLAIALHNGRLFRATPFVGPLDRDLLQLAGYVSPPDELSALWHARFTDLERRSRLQDALDTAVERRDAPTLKVIERELAEHSIRAQCTELAIGQLVVQWLESSVGHSEEASLARLRLARLRAEASWAIDDDFMRHTMFEESERQVTR